MSEKSRRTVVILQPGYLPWLGFFAQMYRSDIFVIYDDVQYDKHGWRNRNRIKTAQGWQWVTVPVLTKGQKKPTNQEVRINNTVNWRAKHLNAIRQNYSQAPFFADYFRLIEEIYRREWTYLIDLNMALIRLLMDLFGLEQDIRFASDLNIWDDDPTRRLVKMCQHLEADCFYEGASGKDYLDEAQFVAANIALEYQDYQHPVYNQLYGEFVPYLSTLDLLLNHGPESLDILTRQRSPKLENSHQQNLET